MPSPLPTSLRTANPAEGLALAHELAARLHASLPVPRTMPEHLRSGAFAPSLELITAILFHAISLANTGWDRPVT